MRQGMPDNKTIETASGNYPKVNIHGLLEIMRNLPEPPTLYAMDYNIVFNDILPNNTIIISKDLAIKLGIWDAR